MQTNVLTPMQIFNLPQHLVVPLFQRPYVWDQDEQWRPLWQDVRRLAELGALDPYSGATHFLGAVVLQAQDVGAGRLSEWNVIDGQQRLTTLQLLMDATAAVLDERGHDNLADQLESFTHNPPTFVRSPDDRLKIRHTNKDRAAFDEVMNSEPPVDHGQLDHASSRIARAHAYFVGEVQAWLDEASPDTTRRAAALTDVLQQRLQLVVINLTSTENSQEIFETLNARGTPLTAADLVKNFVFQKLDAEGADTRRVYAEDWPFERDFWEKELSVGRYLLSRSSLFLNQWLTSRVGEEVSTKSTFTLFKHYVEHSAGQPMSELLATIRRQADQYEAWTVHAAEPDRDLSPVELAVYRMRASGIEVLKPLLIWLHEPGRDVPQPVANRVVTLVESWVMRRQLLRLSTADLGRVVADIIRVNRATAPQDLPASIENYLTGLRVTSTYWPGDREIHAALLAEQAYRRYPRSRLRMFLETAEDHLRSVHHAGRVSRRGYPIEHLLPQKWQAHWPVADLEHELDRSAHVHRLGNLTLLTESLNSAVSNGPWLGARGKRAKLEKYDVLLMNRHVREVSDDGWDEQRIDERTTTIVDALLATWKVPAGHVGEVTDARTSEQTWVELRHLVAAEMLAPGTILSPRSGTWAGVTAVVTSDGRLDIDGTLLATPSAAGRHVRGGATNGWNFWRLEDGRRLADLRAAYRGDTTADLGAAVASAPDPDEADELAS